MLTCYPLPERPRRAQGEGACAATDAAIGSCPPSWSWLACWRPRCSAPGTGLTGPDTGRCSTYDFPILHTHLHFSRDAWSVHSVEGILALMDQAGVYRALVSSTPGHGTLMLYQQAPDRIVPVLLAVPPAVRCVHLDDRHDGGFVRRGAPRERRLPWNPTLHLDSRVC